MRRVLAPVLAALLSGAALTASAQGPAKPPVPGGKPVNIWYVLPDPTPGDPFVPVLKTLKLGGKQVPRMRPWILKANGQRTAALKDKKLKPADQKKKIQDANNAVYWIIDGVLTADQKPAFLAGLKKQGYTPPDHK